MMPSFKNPVEKARWVLQHANVRPKMRLCTNFTKAELRKNRLRKLAREILRMYGESSFALFDQAATKLARMVLR